MSKPHVVAAWGPDPDRQEHLNQMISRALKETKATVPEDARVPCLARTVRMSLLGRTLEEEVMMDGSRQVRTNAALERGPSC